MHRLTPIVLLGLTCACASPPARVSDIADEYLEQYFAMYPSKATAAGRTDLDAELELPTEDRIRTWVRYQDEVDVALRQALTEPGVTPDDHLDAEAVLQQTARERHTYVVLRRHETDPLFWTDLAANALVRHVVRPGRPNAARVTSAVARAGRIPALTAEAVRRIEAVADDRLSAELCRMAAAQAQATAVFYRSAFPTFAMEGDVDASEVARQAADALATLGNALDAASLRASGSGRLGRHYASTLQVHLGLDLSPDILLSEAERDLDNLRQEASAYGRSVWPSLMAGRAAPASDTAVLRALFARVAADRDEDVTSYVAHWQTTVDDLEAFLEERPIVPPPDAPPIVVQDAPSYVLNQATGTVLTPGPYAPGDPAVLLLPVPRPDATATQRTAFFRDYNRHFTRMMAPHQLLPGHVAQAQHAARHPHRVRSVFADPVYVEGWATFCERLLLDRGWGGPLPRLAHLKKQIENAAGAIVDIRVHTSGFERDDVLAFARREALQDDQFADSMWTRALTASTQMVTAHVGYREVRAIYDMARREPGRSFDLPTFIDGMMSLGPVPVRHYRARYTDRR
jgi:uncharacterized protein (DUF885 family)